MTPEGRVVHTLKLAVRRCGGECRKVSWEGRNGAPDWFVMGYGHAFFVECKAPGEQPRPQQELEFRRIRKESGMDVFVVDSEEKAKDVISRELELAYVRMSHKARGEV